MTLFTESQFSNPYDVPESGSTPPRANDAVLLQMSDGSVVPVFDKLSTGLKLLAFMCRNSQWNVYASADVCVSVGAVKLLVMQTSLINQKLVTSYLPIYLGGGGRWASRTASLVLSTTDALKCVGFAHLGELSFSSNLDLRGGAHMQLVDWIYEANPANGGGSLLSDPIPLRYDFT